jgi:uncharacterized iron-regulated membrane protein
MLIIYLLGALSVLSTGLAVCWKIAMLVTYLLFLIVWWKRNAGQTGVLKVSPNGHLRYFEPGHRPAKGQLGLQSYHQALFCTLTLEFFWGKVPVVIVYSSQNPEHFRRLLIYLKYAGASL